VIILVRIPMRELIKQGVSSSTPTGRDEVAARQRQPILFN
jgi:hypothetical protein